MLESMENVRYLNLINLITQPVNYGDGNLQVE